MYILYQFLINYIFMEEGIVLTHHGNTKIFYLSQGTRADAA